MRDVTKLLDYEVVPESLDDRYQWASIRRNPDLFDTTRRYLLVHARVEHDDPEAEFQVAIRLQGFVERINIRPLGNWNQ